MFTVNFQWNSSAVLTDLVLLTGSRGGGYRYLCFYSSKIHVCTYRARGGVQHPAYHTRRLIVEGWQREVLAGIDHYFEVLFITSRRRDAACIVYSFVYYQAANSRLYVRVPSESEFTIQHIILPDQADSWQIGTARSRFTAYPGT